MRIILILFITLLPITDCFSQKRISKNRLLEDFDYAVHELKLQHQGFYNYVDKHKTDTEISILRNSIENSMTKLEFYQLIRQLLGLMNEGHGSVDLPKWTMVKVGLSKSLLPVGVKFLDEELIITQNFGKDIVGLNKGAKIVSINGEPISQILNKLLPLIAADGFNNTSKFEWIGGMNMSLLYRLVYGKKKEFELQIIDSVNRETKTVKIPAIRYTTIKAKNAKFKGKSFGYTTFNFEQINDSIAYLSIPDFGSDVIDYQTFYEKQFKKIDSLSIKHLIIDVQANGGGEEGNENLLFSYLSEKPIRKYKKVSMLPKPYQINKNNKGYKFDKWELKGSIAERGEFTLYSNYYSELGYKPPNKDYVYLNKLYVLISRVTFSGGAEFSSMIKMTNRGVFIGAETGGAYEGNVSGYSETVKLPNTKIRIDIPTVHFQMNVNPEKRGRGIIPDYEVPQTWDDYLNNRNSKLDFTKKMIMN
ncbi:MAG: S41 family peptidase [Flavobacteriaceae bacterium]|nr:S41 family peptidase [Flavobacteriaceae bacterium]